MKPVAGPIAVGIAVPECGLTVSVSLTDGLGYIKEKPMKANFDTKQIRDIMAMEEGEIMHFHLPCDHTISLQRQTVPAGFFVAVTDSRPFISLEEEEEEPHGYLEWRTWHHRHHPAPNDDVVDRYHDANFRAYKNTSVLNSCSTKGSFKHSAAFFVSIWALPMLRAIFAAMSMPKSE
jgi:hypothetical protein